MESDRFPNHITDIMSRDEQPTSSGSVLGSIAALTGVAIAGVLAYSAYTVIAQVHSRIPIFDSALLWFRAAVCSVAHMVDS